MTLIAAHAGEREVHLMTDSAAYTPNSGRHIEMTSDKLVLLPGMSAATLAAGSYPGGIVWRKVAVALAGRVDGFDAWMERAQVAVKAPARLTADRVPDNIHMEVVHTFARDDFRRMVMGTWHPLGQVGPFVCGSGRRDIDCHIPKFP